MVKKAKNKPLKSSLTFIVYSMYTMQAVQFRNFDVSLCSSITFVVQTIQYILQFHVFDVQLCSMYCVLYAVSSWSTIIIIDKQTCCNYEFFLLNLSSWRYMKRWKLSRLAVLLHCLFKISNFWFLDEVFQGKWTRQVAWPKITWTLFEN